MTKHDYIFTPNKHICLGELVCIDGIMSIRVKKPGRDVYDIITMDEISHMCNNHSTLASISEQCPG